MRQHTEMQSFVINPETLSSMWIQTQHFSQFQKQDFLMLYISIRVIGLHYSR